MTLFKCQSNEQKQQSDKIIFVFLPTIRKRKPIIALFFRGYDLAQKQTCLYNKFIYF